MWIILIGATALAVAEAVKMDSAKGLKQRVLSRNSPDPASTLNRRI